MKKNIFLIIPTLGVGGGEKLVIDLAKNINKNKFKVNILVLFPKFNTIYEKNIEKSKDVNLIYLNKKKGIDVRVMFKIVRLFKEYKPDVVHTHLNVMAYILPATILNKVRLRFHTVHSIAQEEAKGISRLVMKLAYKFFNFTPIAICETVKKTIQETYKISEDIPCIYNGIDIDIFKYSNDIKKNNESINLINIGTLYHVKNHELLIEAFYEVQKNYPNITLEIVGDGELRSILERKIKKYKLKEKIILKGYLENVSKELKKSDIYVMSSNYEGLPLSILEAMACGLPIIATNVGGIPEVVTNNKNGILVDVGNKKQLIDALRKIIYDYNLRSIMGKFSLEMSKKYNIQNMTSEYEKLYLK